MKAQYKHQFYQKNKMGTRRSALSEERTLSGYGLWAMTPHTCMSTINPPNEITLTALSN